MQVLFADKQQIDLTEAQALAQSGETSCYELVKALLFTGDYRISGAVVNAELTPDGSVTVDPGVFLKAGGFFYTMAATAFMNILNGVPNPPANVWGTGLAADASNPRKDIICVTYQKVADTPQVKTFINDAVEPPQPFTQTTNTRNESAPLFAVIHGTPSATPSEPAVPSGYMKLATVLVPANATTIVTGDITNNLNINIKTLEELQFGTQLLSAFSDLLHGKGVYATVLGAMEVAETSPQSLGIQVSEGAAILTGVTANVSTVTTVPITAASFVHIASEVFNFASGDTIQFHTNGTPPHKIRAGSVSIPGATEGVDYSVNYSLGTITRLGGGGISPGGSVTGQYDYYLPRIDVIQITFGTNLLSAVVGTPAQAPVAPSVSANSMALANVLVGEGVTVIVDANITDERLFLSSMQEVVDAHDSAQTGAHATLDDRLEAHETRAITSGQAAHGIKQGTGNAFDSDTVDGIHAAVSPTANKLAPMDGSGRYPAADGSQIQNLTVPEAQKLRVSQTGTPGNTVAVAPGSYLSNDGHKLITYAGGTSPSFPVVTAMFNSRIDLLVIDDNGTLTVVQGVQGLSPVPQEYPVGKLVLAEITISDLVTVVVLNAAIKDARNYLQSGRALVDSPSLESADGTTGQDVTQGTGVKTAHIQAQAVSLAKLAADVIAYIGAIGFASGDIVANGGDSPAPAGWVLCDGTSYGRTDPIYANLFAAIGTKWGSIDGAHFNVPDFRGVFLRGANGSASDAFADPDAGSRVARLAGGVTAGVGSFQQDDFKSHNHTYTQPNAPSGITNFQNPPNAAATVGGTAGTTGSTGGNETRPKNAYVQYKIKL